MKKILVCVSAFYVALAASADVIVMKSGAKFVGTVKHIEGGTIDFSSEDVGEIKIKQDNVVSMTTDKANPVEFNDKRIETGVVARGEGGFTLDGKPLDMGEVKAVVPTPETWHGSLNLSASAARGNTVSESVALFADIARRWEKDRITGSAAYNFAQSGDSKEDKQKTSNRFELQAQEDHFWTSMFSVREVSSIDSSAASTSVDSAGAAAFSLSSRNSSKFILCSVLLVRSRDI